MVHCVNEGDNQLRHHIVIEAELTSIFNLK